MKGHLNSEILALYSGGDLDGKRRSTVAAHVSECAECRQHVAEFRAVSTRFSALQLEPQEEDLRAVRQTVSEAIAARQPEASYWPMLWAIGAAAVLLMVVFVFNVRQSSVPAPHLRELVSLPPALLPEVPLIIRRERKRMPKTEAGVRSVSIQDGTLKLETNDPNVVILLAFEERRREN